MIASSIDKDIDEVPCKFCGEMTSMQGTQLCDFCWEIRYRARRKPKLALEIVLAVFEELADEARVTTSNTEK